MNRTSLPTPFAVALVAVTLVAGCIGGRTTISSDDYDKSCSTDDDCIVVAEGDVCGCPCTYGAINESEQEAYEAERSKKGDRCMSEVYCEPCPAPKAVCSDDNRCTTVPRPKPDARSDAGPDGDAATDDVGPDAETDAG